MRKRKGMSVVAGSVLLAGCLMVGSSWAADTATRSVKNSAEIGGVKKPGLAAKAGAAVPDAAQEKTQGRKHTKSGLAAALPTN